MDIMEVYGTALLVDDKEIIKLCEAVFNEDDECLKKEECCKECKYKESENDTV